MKQIEVIIKALRELEDLVVDQLYDYRIEGVSVEDDNLIFEFAESSAEWEMFDLPEKKPGKYIKIHVFFDEEEYYSGIESSLDANLASLTAEYGRNCAIIVSAKVPEDTNWQTEWKKYYKPTKLGEKMVIVPSWEEYHPVGDEIIIELDPGMAFGTGTHASTALCVELLQQLELNGKRVLDVGCGSGILSIAAAKLGAETVTAVDIDPICIATTKENAEINRVLSIIDTAEGDLTSSVTGHYDVVFANIIAEIVIRLLDDLSDHMKPGGVLIVSGIIDEKSDAVLKKLEEKGFDPKKILHKDGWTGISAVYR